MSVQKVRVDGSGQDGMFVWWEPGRIKVSDLRDALTAAGYLHLMPKSSTVASALRETLNGFIEAAKIKVRGSPVVISPLREDIKGFEAVRQDRGDTENFHDFVISVVEDNGAVKIAKHNPQYVPQADIIKDQLEEKMTEVFQAQLDWIPTSMATSTLARVVQAMGGIVCRRAGGIYFLPEKSAGVFGQLADAMDAADGELSVTITVFPLNPGERSYRLVLESIRKEVNEGLVEIESALADLGDRKQRSDGQTNRLNALDAMKAKLTQYESLLGVTMQDMHDAVEKVKSAVAARNVLDMCA
jgi:hypothetical protein